MGMTTKDEAERGLLCRTVDLCIACVREGLDEGAPIFLVVCYVMAKVGKNGLIESLGLAVYLREICCGR